MCAGVVPRELDANDVFRAGNVGRVEFSDSAPRVSHGMHGRMGRSPASDQSDHSVSSGSAAHRQER